MSISEPRDELLKGLLQLPPSSHASEPSAHPDDEALAQFALGELSSAERLSVVNHLADCDPCRQAVAEVLRAESSENNADVTKSASASPTAFRPFAVSWVLATAAGLFVLVSGVALFTYSLSAPGEGAVYARALAALEAGRYDAARQEVDQANALKRSKPGGLRSARTT